MNEKLIKILAEVFEIKESAIQLDLTNGDIDTWDSLRQMDLVVSLEEGFDISLEIEDIIAMNSVQSIVDVLTTKGAFS